MVVRNVFAEYIFDFLSTLLTEEKIPYLRMTALLSEFMGSAGGMVEPNA